MRKNYLNKYNLDEIVYILAELLAVEKVNLFYPDSKRRLHLESNSLEVIRLVLFGVVLIFILLFPCEYFAADVPDSQKRMGG